MFNWQCLSGDRQKMEASKTLRLFSLKNYDVCNRYKNQGSLSLLAP